MILNKNTIKAYEERQALLVGEMECDDLTLEELRDRMNQYHALSWKIYHLRNPMQRIDGLQYDYKIVKPSTNQYIR